MDRNHPTGPKRIPRTIRAALTVVLTGLLSTAFAQYYVHQWENFEMGTIMPGYTPIGPAFDTNVKVVEYSKLPMPPPGMLDEFSSKEIGKFGLAVTISPETRIAGLGVGVILDRLKLGAAGRALYQGDFFIPDASQTIPGLAVLAMEPMMPGLERPARYYRFGSTRDRDYYFSYVETVKEKATLYKFDKKFKNTVPRPGWHRYQIVFEGATTIRCYLDGHETPFSPIEEPELTQLQVGIMAAEELFSYTCYVDNLSIQFSTEDCPLPDSPYAVSWGDAPATSMAQHAGGGAAAAKPASAAGQGAAAQARPRQPTMEWLDPLAAGERALATNSPVLVCFYAPRVTNTMRLGQLIQATPEAQAFLSRQVLAAIDVNQLQGGVYARQFNVFRVPTLLMMTPSGQELARVTFDQSLKWPAIEATLSRAAPGAVPPAAGAPGQPASSQ